MPAADHAPIVRGAGTRPQRQGVLRHSLGAWVRPRTADRDGSSVPADRAGGVNRGMLCYASLCPYRFSVFQDRPLTRSSGGAHLLQSDQCQAHHSACCPELPAAAPGLREARGLKPRGCLRPVELARAGLAGRRRDDSDERVRAFDSLLSTLTHHLQQWYSASPN